MKMGVMLPQLLLCVVNLFFVHTSKLPDYIHVCKRSDPDLNGCVQKAIEELRPRLISGMPEMNVPSIEPLILDDPIATEGSGIKVATKNLKVYGGSNYTIKNMDIDPFVPKINFRLGFPHMFIDGSFNVDGKIIMISFKGNGNIKADLNDIDCQVTVVSELVTRDSAQYLKVNGVDLEHLQIAKGKVMLENLFEKNDKMIGDVINSAINLNFNFFIQELKPVIAQTLSQFAVKTANNIAGDVPLTELFPE